MAKKYIPSGYQIITLTEQDFDEDDFLIVKSEDSKKLFEIFNDGGQLKFTKPILLTYEDITGFVVCAKQVPSLILSIPIFKDDGTLDFLYQVIFTWENGKVSKGITNI